MTNFRFAMTHNPRRPVYPDGDHKSQAFEPRPCDTPDPIDEHEEFNKTRPDMLWLGAVACALSAAVVLTGAALVVSKMGAW